MRGGKIRDVRLGGKGKRRKEKENVEKERKKMSKERWTRVGKTRQEQGNGQGKR